MAPMSDEPMALAAQLEANKDVARRILLEVIDAANFQLADELIEADYVEHRAGADSGPALDGLKAWIEEAHVGFPGLTPHC